MASGSYAQVHVVCPYYRTDNGKDTIRCEGIISNTTNNYFRTRDEFRFHIQQFCSGKYWFCKCCEALDGKYEEEP